MKYAYVAVLTPEKSGYSVSFPDVEGCVTQGDTISEAFEMAQDALNLMLVSMEDDKDEIPSPTDFLEIKVDDNCIKTIVSADTTSYRKMVETVAVRRTVSIPQWMDNAARGKGLSYSKMLQEAILEKLQMA